MRVRLLRAALFAFAASGIAGECRPSLRVDQRAGTWSDAFADLGGVDGARHLKRAVNGGACIDPAEQSWSVPGNAGFPEGNPDAAVEITGSGTGRSAVTLWQRVLQPGRDMAVASVCAPTGTALCPLDRSVTGRVNGIVHRRGGAGYPVPRGGRADIAGWDTTPTSPGSPPACAVPAGSRYGGIRPFDGRPLLSGKVAVPTGVRCAASFAASADHDSTEAPYLGFRFRGSAAGASAADDLVVGEAGLALPFSVDFADMTPVTVVAPAPSAGGDWEVGVVSRAGTEAHCTVLGPVFVTAVEGTYRSPVLDTLTDETAWTRIEWEAEQNSGVSDPSCACPTPGSPVTPVAISFDAGSMPPSSWTQEVPGPVPGSGTAPVPAGVKGRYLGFSVVLHGRDTASSVMPMLAPVAGRAHFSGWRPVLRRLGARYYARAAEAISKPVVPSALKAWTAVSWDAETPGGSSVIVDVLAGDGSVLLAAVARSANLEGAVDPYRHTSLVLRARLSCDPANPGNRPVLNGWRVEWAPLDEPLMLDRKEFAPGAGESVSGLVPVRRGGRVRVRVHDAAGKTVVVPVDGFRDARAIGFSWDGKDSVGKAVAPGVYSVTATTAGGAGTRKVAVRR